MVTKVVLEDDTGKTTEELLRKELEICHRFLYSIVSDLPCDAKCASDCTPCRADSILARSKFIDLEKLKEWYDKYCQ